MNDNFALGVVLTTAIVLILCGTLFEMRRTSETESTKRLTACASSGGSYLPIDRNGSYQCINKLNK